jgi:hypothetical protein
MTPSGLRKEAARGALDDRAHHSQNRAHERFMPCLPKRGAPTSFQTRFNALCVSLLAWQRFLGNLTWEI